MTSQQKKTFNLWNDHARYSYNKAVWLMNETGEYNKFYLRNMITPAEVNGDKQWLLETPKDVRAGAVFEASKNIEAAFTNLKNKNIKKFKMGFKRKSNSRWSIVIPSKALSLTTNTVTKNRFIKIFPKSNTCPIVRTCEQISPEMLEHDCLLHFDGSEYYLCAPCIKSSKSVASTDSISLDPGVRTFLTGYSPDGTICKLGDNVSNRLLRLLLKADKIQSLITKETRRNCRKNLKRNKIRILQKVRNLTNEMHHKIALYLVSNYKNILIPDFESKNMCNRKTRKIRCKTVRQMLSLGHGKFKTILKAKAIEYGANLIWTDEAYTTKTCGCCGCMNHNIGSKKEWVCENCNTKHARDGNASRNVFIASITDVDYDKESVSELLALLDRTTVDNAVLTAREIDLYQYS